MTILKDLYKDLEKYKDFEEGENDMLFLETVDRIIAFHDPSSLGILFKYFDDEDRGWVLESLKGIIKSQSYLDDEQFVIALLKNLHILVPNAKGWAQGFFYIVLNEPKCLYILENNIHIAKKQDLEIILNNIYEESEVHRKIIKKLRRQII